MKKEIEIHPVQARILRELLFKQEAGFAELNVLKLPTDHFTFHLKSLVEAQLLEKTPKGYQLTSAGKEFANRFDTDSREAVYEKQAKVSVLPCGVMKEGGVTKYLIQERLKQPFYGYRGFMSGKIRKGDTPLETARREFKEETGLAGDFVFRGVLHKMDYSAENELLEDKYFFVFRVDNPQGELIESFEGGRNLWLPKKEILSLPRLFPSVKEVIEMLSREQMEYLEGKYKAAGF